MEERRVGEVVLGQRRALLLPAHGLDEFVQIGKVGVGLLGREQFLHVPTTTRDGQPNENRNKNENDRRVQGR